MSSGLALAAWAAVALAATPPVTEFVLLADSHGLGPFGRYLDEGLERVSGAHVRTYAVGGSAPLWWFKGTRSRCGLERDSSEGVPPSRRPCAPMKTPLVKELLAGPGANRVVVVELGSNNVGDKPGFVRATSKQLLSAIAESGSRCVWIGPPRMRRFSKQGIDAVYAAIEGAIADSGRAPCKLVDSRSIGYPDKGGDGVHYTFPAGEPLARRWADQALAEISTLLP